MAGTVLGRNKELREEEPGHSKVHELPQGDHTLSAYWSRDLQYKSASF